MATDDKPPRAQTFGGEGRHSRRNPSAGAPVEHIDDEVTPPPMRLPPLIGRSPTPDDGRFARLESKVNELVDATWRTWGVRDVDQRIDRIELELKDNTRSTIRMEAVLGELVVPAIKEQMAKMDTTLHHIAASSHLAASVAALVGKLDHHGTRFDGIEKEQALAAERFEAHDLRDAEIHEVAKDAVRRISAVENRLSIADTTAKVRKQVAGGIRPWWFTSKGVGVVAAAIAAAIATVIAATHGG